MNVLDRKSFLSLVGVALFSTFAVGCETVEGVGEDIEDLGDEIEDEANDAQRNR
jgi:predicted small secreted protein